MDNVHAIFPVILYILLSILLVALIVLTIRIITTLKRVDAAIDDYNEKSKKLNGLFEIIDSTTDTISSLSDRLVNIVINGISSLFIKKKKKEKKEDE